MTFLQNSTLFLILTLGNIAVPLSCNFVGEYVSLLGVWNSNPFICILACSGIILSACYALFLYNRVAFGAVSQYLEPHSLNRDISRRDFYVLFPLIFGTIYLGVYPDIVFSTLHPSVNALLN